MSPDNDDYDNISAAYEGLTEMMEYLEVILLLLLLRFVIIVLLFLL